MDSKIVDCGSHSILLQNRNDVWMPTFFGITLIELMRLRITQGMRVLELGTGSGVTAIAARLFGAGRVVTLDLNPAAQEAIAENAVLNGVKSELDARRSDMFSALAPDEQMAFDLLVSNPPTFPAVPPCRTARDRDDWEMAGQHGREMLDVLISQGQQWIRKGGSMLFIATSTQGWNQTEQKLADHGWRWRVLEAETIPLAPHYHAFIPFWLRRGEEISDALIYTKPGENGYFQTVYFVEAW